MKAERPIHKMLLNASGRISGHMPGHKGRSPFDACDLYALDTTELSTTDNLYAPSAAIEEAQCLYAVAVGAGATLFMHNGATAGIHAMLQMYARPGDTVLLPRNAHLSAVNACVLGGLRIAWIPVRSTLDGACAVAEEDVLNALQTHPTAKALLLTRPDYYGMCLPLERIAKTAGALNIRLLVDEAHGAHLPWIKAPCSSGEAGADAWVQSAHKTLPALTGSAVLNLRKKGDRSAALRVLRREQTSSPSFLLLRSIDDARAWAEDVGAARMAENAARCRRLIAHAEGLGYANAQNELACLSPGAVSDPLRVVLSAPQGGFTLLNELSQRGVDAEMADFRRVVMIFSGMSAEDDFAAVAGALSAIAPHEEPIPRLSLPPKAECVCNVRTAALARVIQVPLQDAVGRICAQSVGLYPPGIPLCVPGELLSHEIVEVLLASLPDCRFGLEGDCLLCADV